MQDARSPSVTRFAQAAAGIAVAIAAAITSAGPLIAGQDRPQDPDRKRGGFQWRPPFIKTIDEQVVVKPASSRVEWLPAEYETRTRVVATKPASVRRIPIPAEYKTVTEQVLVAKGHWTQTADGKNVWVPPVYETRTRQVVSKPASERVETIPAEYKTESYQVMVRAAVAREIPIPAEYATRTRTEQHAGEWVWAWGSEYLNQRAFDVSACRTDSAHVAAVRSTLAEQLTKAFEGAKLWAKKRDDELPPGSLRYLRHYEVSEVLSTGSAGTYFEDSSYDVTVYSDETYVRVNLVRGNSVSRSREADYGALPPHQQAAYENEVIATIDAAIAETAKLHQATSRREGILEIKPPAASESRVNEP